MAATTVGAVQSVAQPQPIGVGANPIQFNLLDDQGKWYDSGLDLQGDQSLAVAVLPRAGVPGGNASPELARSLSNVDLADSLVNLTPTDRTTSAPTTGSLGVDPLAALNLDNLLSAVRVAGQTNGESAVSAAKAETLIGQLAPQLAASPADAPINLLDLPVGAELMSTLGDLQAQAPVSQGVLAKFSIAAPTASAHTVTGLIWPKGAANFPFDQAGAFVGDTEVELTEPGLYAFACKIHPYMLGAVVVDDPLTPGADFGKELVVNARGLSVPSNADIIAQLVNKFFVITNPGNWQHFSNTEERQWNPVFPPAPILQWDAAGAPVLVPNLDAFMKQKFDLPKTLPALTQRPATPGVGEVWIDTQMEKFAGKRLFELGRDVVTS